METIIRSLVKLNTYLPIIVDNHAMYIPVCFRQCICEGISVVSLVYLTRRWKNRDTVHIIGT